MRIIQLFDTLVKLSILFYGAFGPGPGPGGQSNFDIFKISHVYYKLTDKLMPNTFAVTTIGGT